jgi:isopenicillin N synthase-like dioxygenase
VITICRARRDLQNIHADADARRQLADTVRDACINVGFFYSKSIIISASRQSSLEPAPVSNHGIPQQIVSKALEAGKQFFALPQAAKDAIDISKSPNYKGYTPLLGENSNPENRGDLHEGFDIGWEDASGNSRTDDGAMTGGNVWPDRTSLPGFREAVLDY